MSSNPIPNEPEGVNNGALFTSIVLVALATLGVAVLSSLLAAWRATTIDPGEALRHE